jgi:hypothetical protein
LVFDDYDTYTLSFLRNAAPEARALFWTETGSAHSDFLKEFQDAIYEMPGLHTLASKPMDPRREVTLSTLGYTITIAMITVIIRNDDRSYLNSNGFINFIIPTLKALANPSALSIRINKPPTIMTVVYADEGMVHSTALTRIAKSDAMIFSTLRRLDLCIGGLRCVPADLEGFLTCLSNARKLTSFKLCQEAGMTELRVRLPDMGPFMFPFMVPQIPPTVKPDPDAKKLLKLIPTMPNLTDLWIVDPDLQIVAPDVHTDANYAQTNGIIKFIGRHSKTLKKVYLISVCIKKWILPKLAAMEGLKELKRFVVVSKIDIDEDKAEHISEQQALDYINGRNNAQIPYDHRDGETELHTHDAIFDVDTWRTAAFCDTRDNKWRERGYDPIDVKRLDYEIQDRRDEHGVAYDLGARRIKDSVTSLWSDSNGVFYDPATDTEVDDPEGKSYEPKDDTWTTQGQRTWNSELGLWRDGITGRLERFAIDRKTWDKPDDPDRDDRELEPNASESHQGSESSALYLFNAGEEEEYYLRAEMAPRWGWGRDATGQVWFWQVSSTAGHATEVWRFQHKGEYAYGHEPLDFWCDWRERNEPESTAEATPYGWNLLYFVSETNEVVGSEIPKPGSCDSLTLYKYEDDPTWDDGVLGVDMYRWLPPPSNFERLSKKKWTDVYKECLNFILTVQVLKLFDKRNPIHLYTRALRGNH